MSSILSIAVSGITASSERLQDSASNVANAESDGPTPSASAATQAQYPQPYTPKLVRQVATAGGATRAYTSNVQPASVLAYDPTAPYVDQNGEVAKPNVNITSEAYQQLTARYDFVLNAYVARVYSRMQKSVVDIHA
ncbi:MAG TPA: flagellar biosynthesis protein FlgC [Xanthobacteraceae bacterium]|jgi:flagellar basal-body rod protein FlgC|nr:flagellar biosynthesis protein FlgC [Xanthobacteraceae bacterium]